MGFFFEKFWFIGLDVYICTRNAKGTVPDSGRSAAR